MSSIFKALQPGGPIISGLPTAPDDFEIDGYLQSSFGVFQRLPAFMISGSGCSAGWGANARVLAPETLKEMIRSEIEALNQLYE